MKKVLTIVGARPQFIKAASLSRAFSKVGGIEEVIVHTGQHFDKNMSDVFFEEMQIPSPQYNLSINSLGHGAMTGRMIESIEEVIKLENPHLLLVYGDTNSTLAGALAAVKLHIPIAHVEAGLRSFNMEMPEEVNRILTDRISNLLFCPTETAVKNLKQEGYDKFGTHIINSGDVMEDAAKYYERLINEKSNTLSLEAVRNSGSYYLCTIHRAENTNDKSRMEEIVNGLNKLAESHNVVLPMHPRIKSLLSNYRLNSKVHLIDPVGYFDMVTLIKNARLIITDSGGLQKEAYFFSKFCVTIRDQTEWTELVDHGFNSVVGANSKFLLAAVQDFEQKVFNRKVKLYGNGRAAQTIASYIKNFLNK